MTRVLGLTTSTGSSFYRDQERALRDRGIDYTTLGVPGTHDPGAEGVDRRSALDYARYYPRVLRRAVRGADLVHANYGLTAPFGVLQPIRPLVVTLWGGEFGPNRFAPVVRRALSHASTVVVPSRAMVDRLPSTVRDRTTVVPFPVDTDRFRPRPKAAARAAVDWDDDATVVVFPYATGRFEKNYPLAARVVDGIEDVELRTVADVPHERVADYLNASDALLVTSRWESGPMTAKEALACGVPVVSRPVGFVPECCSDCAACRIGTTERELRAALRAVLSADETPSCRDQFTAYDRDAFGERLAAVYDGVLGDQ